MLIGYEDYMSLKMEMGEWRMMVDSRDVEDRMSDSAQSRFGTWLRVDDINTADSLVSCCLKERGPKFDYYHHL